MIELSGFDDDIAAFDAAGADPAKISDGFIDTLAAIGSAEDAIATVRRYADSGATSPCLGGIAKTDFDATLEALAGSIQEHTRLRFT